MSEKSDCTMAIIQMLDAEYLLLSARRSMPDSLTEDLLAIVHSIDGMIDRVRLARGDSPEDLGKWDSLIPDPTQGAGQ